MRQPTPHGSHDFRLGSGAGGSSRRTSRSNASSNPIRQPHGKFALWLLATMMMSNANAADIAAVDNLNSVVAERRSIPMRTGERKYLKGRANENEPNTSAPQTSTFAQRRLIIFASAIWSMLMCGMVIGMLRGPNEGGTAVQGPTWDASGHISFRRWLLEVMPWLNVTQQRR